MSVFPSVLLRLCVVLALCPIVAFSDAVTPRGGGAQHVADLAPVAVAVRARPVATLNSVGSRYVRAPIPVKGYTSGQDRGRHKLVLQRYSPRTHRWFKRSVKYVRNGVYRFPAQYGWGPGRVRLRTVLYARGRPVDRSNVLAVRVISKPRPTCASAPSATTCPKPAVRTEQRRIEVPSCPQLTVATHDETRKIDWRWNAAVRRWVEDPTPWVMVPGSEGERPAGAADCVKVVDQVPAGAVLPDLRIKDLTKCGAGDSAATGGTCFMIVPSAPPNPSFPALEGAKLLKFGVITLNVGAGPGEIIADRSGSSAADWKAYQSFYDVNGALLGSLIAPDVDFYFAGDGHNHWHVRDFDNYELLDADGIQVARSEKHGYCMQDNTTYQPLQGSPGVPPSPVYTDAQSCGKGLPNVLTIVHGLSRGWGDTYPTSLPDQAINITGVADGTYTVRVYADAIGAVKESNEDNNVAEVKIEISGDTVTVVPGTSTGGLG